MSPQHQDSQDERTQSPTVQLPSPFFPPSLSATSNNAPTGTNSSIPRRLPEHPTLPGVPTSAQPRTIDAPDQGTPDAWIPRDPRLVRLTGKHPFNSESKLRDLYSAGFITPSSLFFVRNHGAVPRVDQEKGEGWQVKIHGLCQNPTVLTINDLRTKFRVVTIPITLVCAGNRRKEQNIIQQSLGFSWGAGGVSTALFTGVYLADVLAHVQPVKGARHVVFEGADALPNGPYGTSQLLSWASDVSKGMMLAWAMNGLALEPDHGYPLRLVVPSQIGGRSVKWLTRIELSAVESQHHLHFHDNKVLPMPLGPDRARKEMEWWYDPRYIIRDLNVNSAIACPDHDEVLDTSIAPTYTVRGYAYAGGGRRVTRVELSTDNGDTWELASITYPEDTFREAILQSDKVYGDVDVTDTDRSFCWCFWSYDMPTKRLEDSRALIVRAMDEGMAVQPRDMYWNATGMMNNWWFRVAIHKLDDNKIRFEHPTMAGTQPGGWMQRLKDEGLDPSKPEQSFAIPSEGNAITLPKPQKKKISMIKAGVSRKITSVELASKEAKDEAWFVVAGEVYVGSRYMNDHPGGAASIKLMAGEDATEDFMAVHSEDAQTKLANFHIGTFVKVEDGKVDGKLEDEENDDVGVPFLKTKKWRSAKLVEIRNISKDSKIFRFAFRNPEQQVGLEIGQHLFARLRRKARQTSSGDDVVQRAYTPLWEKNAKGFVDLLVKLYYPSGTFPGGRMSVAFAELALGDGIEFKGPLGHFVWKGRGVASVNERERRVREIGLICGGSGITPVLQVIRGILSDPAPLGNEDTVTKAWLLDSNTDVDDILCKGELDELAAGNEEILKVHYTLTGKVVPEGWHHSRGRISLDMLKEHLPSPGDDKIICMCGPAGLEQSAKANLIALGWDATTQIVVF